MDEGLELKTRAEIGTVTLLVKGFSSQDEGEDAKAMLILRRGV